MPVLPAMEAMLTARPQPAAAIAGRASRRQWKVPDRFTSMACRHCSSVVFTSGAEGATPAAFTRMSIPPSAARASAKSARTDAGSATSTVRAIAAAPASRAPASRFASRASTSRRPPRPRRASAPPPPPAPRPWRGRARPGGRCRVRPPSPAPGAPSASFTCKRSGPEGQAKDCQRPRPSCPGAPGATRNRRRQQPLVRPARSACTAVLGRRDLPGNTRFSGCEPPSRPWRAPRSPCSLS